MIAHLPSIYAEDAVCCRFGIVDDVTARSAIRHAARTLEIGGIPQRDSLDAMASEALDQRDFARHALTVLSVDLGCEPHQVRDAIRDQAARHLSDLIRIAMEVGAKSADAASIIEAIRAGRGA